MSVRILRPEGALWGWLDDPLTVEACRRYLDTLPSSVKTIVVGCTHCPVLRPSFDKARPGMRCIDNREAAAVEQPLTSREVKREGPRGDLKVLLTDASSRLQEVDSRFLGEAFGAIKVVDI